MDPDLIIELESDREETIKKYKTLARARANKQRQAQ
jgi:hypothetical protein